MIDSICPMGEKTVFFIFSDKGAQEANEALIQENKLLRSQIDDLKVCHIIMPLSRNHNVFQYWVT